MQIILVGIYAIKGSQKRQKAKADGGMIKRERQRHTQKEIKLGFCEEGTFQEIESS